MLPQFADKTKKTVDYDNMVIGMRYFVLGLAKKVLLADRLMQVVDLGFADPSKLNSVSALVTVLSYTMQIYFDFSGYSDMAVGLGKMFNIDIPLNFTSPYRAHTIREFWERWHMTLTRFLTKYLYIPLGGNRKGNLRTYANILIVFTLSGLWHGANWTFVFWGILHGIAMMSNRFFRKTIDRVPKIILLVATFGFVNIAWVFFRAESLQSGFDMLVSILQGGSGGVSTDIGKIFIGQGLEHAWGRYAQYETVAGFLTEYSVYAWLLFAMIAVFRLPNTHELVNKIMKYSLGWNLLIAVLAIFSIVSLSEVTEFLYFNF
jgi:D-alanyl-lipoteichoic acid acyltransferase DltB (MBOAT superfamily)